MAFFEKLLAAIFNGGYVEVDSLQLVSIASFAGMISMDAGAYEAARQAAHDAGEDIPPWFAQVFLKDDRVAWGRIQEQTRRQFEASISRHAIAGAGDYVRGRRGNAYTSFLSDRFGPAELNTPSLALSGTSRAAMAGHGHAPPRNPNEVLVWSGSQQYDRFGMKQFSAIIPNNCDARRLLGKVSTALNKVVAPVSEGRPWRTLQGVIDSDLHPTARAFEADGRYTADNRPFVSRDGARLTIRSDVAGGKGRGDSGTVHLECIAVTPDLRKEALLVVRFSQNTVPMWLHRQSEALIACTLLGLADQLGAAIKSPVKWEFRRGDWIHSQLLMLPGHGAVELARARG